MQILISLAYGCDSERIQGPAWIAAQQYDLAAKSEGGRKLSYEELKPLLQALLAQRFQLARGIGLAAVNRLPPLKRLLMRDAMGIAGDLPRLVRGEPL